MRQIPIASIEQAAETVYEAAVRTPLVRLELPLPGGQQPAAEIYLKLESLQPIGSFKIRGAWNAVRALSREQLQGGVWTVSAGNAAQGVALAARRAGAPCSVMVMDTAPQTKIDSIERLGARITRVAYEEAWKTVEQHGSDRMEGTFVHPFDDDLFIAGNGTAGLEILEDVPDLDAVIAPLGGGGLLAGIGAVMRARRPGVKVYAAEPETAAPLATSMARGQASYFDSWQASFVDGAGGKSVLPTMWPLLRRIRGRIHRGLSGRGRRGDETRRRASARHRRGRCRLRGGSGAQRSGRWWKDCRGRVRWQHRPCAVRLARGRLRR